MKLTFPAQLSKYSKTINGQRRIMTISLYWQSYEYAEILSAILILGEQLIKFCNLGTVYLISPKLY
jgi:hypothetical protein